MTARKVHHLLGLRAEIAGESSIRISDRDGAELIVNAPVGLSTIPVGFSGLDRATPAGGEADVWISERIGRPLRLVWQADPTLRPISEKHGGLAGESLSLADDGPLLLVAESSMRQLNDWIAADETVPDVPDLDPEDLSDDVGDPVSIRTRARSVDHAAPLDIVRFRPNVIVDGLEPFVEDRWARVWIGGVVASSAPTISVGDAVRVDVD